MNKQIQPVTDTQSLEQRIEGRIDTQTTQSLAISNDAGGLSFSHVGQAMEFGKLMAISQVAVPKHLRGNPGACLAVVIQAVEWRMSPYAVANKSYSVNDRLAYEAQLIQAVILQRAPIKGRIKTEYLGEGGKRKCKVWAELLDEPGEIVEYESPEFDKILPKNSPLWKNDPDQQHHYFSVRAWCRRHFPDVILGVYAKDELDDGSGVGPNRARDVTPRASLIEKLDELGARDSTVATDDGEIIEHSDTAEQTLDAPTPDASDESPEAKVAPSESSASASGPTIDLNAAYQAGRNAAMEGKSRRAMPATYRDEGNEEASTAWNNGFNEAHDEANSGEE